MPVEWLTALMVVALMTLPLVWRAVNRPRLPCRSCSNRTRNPGRRCDRCQRRAAEEQGTRDQANAEMARRREQEEEAKRLADESAREQAKAEEERKRQGERRKRYEEWKEREKERKARLRTLEGLQALGEPEFEALIAELFAREGYRTVHQGGGDHEGIDLVLHIESNRDAVQCKRGKSDLESPDVREFHGSMTRAGARQGFVITTAGFSDRAREFARGKPLTLIDGPALVGWVNGRPRPRGSGGGPRPSDEPGFDPYAVLGIPRSANGAGVRKAYRRLMAQYHPDKVARLGPELRQLALRKSQEINRAYQILTER